MSHDNVSSSISMCFKKHTLQFEWDIKESERFRWIPVDESVFSFFQASMSRSFSFTMFSINRSANVMFERVFDSSETMNISLHDTGRFQSMKTYRFSHVDQYHISISPEDDSTDLLVIFLATIFLHYSENQWIHEIWYEWRD